VVKAREAQNVHCWPYQAASCVKEAANLMGKTSISLPFANITPGPQHIFAVWSAPIRIRH
jgi:hypothetical protein